MNWVGELPSLEEIDRQLNNPLYKTWALTFQDNLGANKGDMVQDSGSMDANIRKGLRINNEEIERLKSWTLE